MVKLRSGKKTHLTKDSKQEKSKKPPLISKKTTKAKSTPKKSKKNITMKKQPIIPEPTITPVDIERPKNTIKIISKIYPTDYPNSKNVKMGQYMIDIKSDDFPISSYDEANYMVNELVNYSNFMGNYKDEYTKENLTKTNKDFFKVDNQEWYMIPVTYKEETDDAEEGTISNNKKTFYRIISKNRNKSKIEAEIKKLQQELDKTR